MLRFGLPVGHQNGASGDPLAPFVRNRLHSPDSNCRDHSSRGLLVAAERMQLAACSECTEHPSKSVRAGIPAPSNCRRLTSGQVNLFRPIYPFQLRPPSRELLRHIRTHFIAARADAGPDGGVNRLRALFQNGAAVPKWHTPRSALRFRAIPRGLPPLPGFGHRPAKLGHNRRCGLPASRPGSVVIRASPSPRYPGACAGTTTAEWI